MFAADAEEALEPVDADYFATNDYATVNIKTTEQFNKLSAARQRACCELMPCFLEHSTCCSPRIICGECREGRAENCARPGQCVVVFKNCSNKDDHAQDIFEIEDKCHKRFGGGNDYREIIELKKISLRAGPAPNLSNALQAHSYALPYQISRPGFGYCVFRRCPVGDDSFLHLLIGKKADPLSFEERSEITKLVHRKNNFMIGESIGWREHNLRIVTLHPFVMEDEDGNEYEMCLVYFDCVVEMPKHWVPNQINLTTNWEIFNNTKPSSFNPQVEFCLPHNIAVTSVHQIQNIDYLIRFNKYSFGNDRNSEVIFSFFGSQRQNPRDIVVKLSALDRFDGVEHMTFEDTFERADVSAYETQNHESKIIIVMSIKYYVVHFVDEAESGVISADQVAEIFSTCVADLLVVRNSDSSRSYFVRNKKQLMPTYLIRYQEMRD